MAGQVSFTTLSRWHPPPTICPIYNLIHSFSTHYSTWVYFPSHRKLTPTWHHCILKVIPESDPSKHWKRPITGHIHDHIHATWQLQQIPPSSSSVHAYTTGISPQISPTVNAKAMDCPSESREATSPLTSLSKAQNGTQRVFGNHSGYIMSLGKAVQSGAWSMRLYLKSSRRENQPEVACGLWAQNGFSCNWYKGGLRKTMHLIICGF